MSKEMTECIDISSAVKTKTTKVCGKCKVKKDVSEYRKNKSRKDGLQSECKKCGNKRGKKYRERSDIKEKMKKYREVPENREKIKKERNKWQNNKRKADPLYRINDAISKGLHNSLKSKGLSKNGKHWENLVGWNKQEFIDYITPLFRKKIVNGKEIIMNWKNFGSEWQLDHICPNAKCGKTEADVIYKWRLENLQPLWKEDNREKKDRLDWSRDESKYILLVA